MAIDAVGRRGILDMVAHSVVTVGVLVTAYYLAPLDRPLGARTVLMLLLTLLLFGVLTVHQVRGILRSRRPRLRAIRALIVGVPLLMVVFAATYCTVSAQLPESFTEPLGRTDGLYFTVTIFATVGFGDISPVSELARVLVMTQMLVGLLTVGVIAKVLFGAVQMAESRQTKEQTSTSGILAEEP